MSGESAGGSGSWPDKARELGNWVRLMSASELLFILRAGLGGAPALAFPGAAAEVTAMPGTGRGPAKLQVNIVISDAGSHASFSGNCGSQGQVASSTGETTFQGHDLISIDDGPWGTVGPRGKEGN